MTTIYTDAYALLRDAVHEEIRRGTVNALGRNMLIRALRCCERDWNGEGHCIEHPIGTRRPVEPEECVGPNSEHGSVRRFCECPGCKESIPACWASRMCMDCSTERCEFVHEEHAR